MKKIFYSILDVLYPGRCPVCHRILKDKRTSVCPECRDTFRPVRGHYCLKCGKPVKPDEEYCRECGKGTRSFDRGRGVFLYDGIMRRSLVRYKYYGCREYGDYYGEEICRYAGGEIRRWAPDVIVPVPLYKRKLRMRGFNQSAYLARKIGETLGIPVRAGGGRCFYHRGNDRRRCGLSESGGGGKSAFYYSLHRKSVGELRKKHFS